MKIRINLEALKFFWKQNTKGGVTVFICAVLIPVMMFTGFITDLARIKLYHSEAAGAAENYADAVLSQYDELLYDVYGLLSVTQNEEGLKALDTIKEYMESAYDPSSVGKVTNASESSLKYIPNNVVFIGMNNDKLNSSWAPYNNTKMSLDKVIDNSGSNGANLSNKYIFSNQVCDYMKIVGPVDLAWNGITDAIDSGERIKENAEIMNERKEVDKLYHALDEKLSKLYIYINGLNECDEWEPANEAVNAASSMNSAYNGLYNNYIFLAGGTSGSIIKYEDNCELGDLFNKAINALRDGDDGVNTALFEQWKNEMGTESVGDDNYLYKICYIRAKLDADDSSKSKIGYKNPNTGTSYTINLNAAPNKSKLERLYWFKWDIERIKETVNSDFDKIQNMLNDDGKLLTYLKFVITLLGGGEIAPGAYVDGTNSMAAEAENKRGNFVEKCSDKTDNEMAQGLANEYSFTDEGAKEMKFVGDFDYNWLRDKYQNNTFFLQKLSSYLEADRSLLLSKLDNLERDILTGGDPKSSLVAYLDSKIADLEAYANGTMNADNVKWRWNYGNNVSSISDKNNLIFSGIDNVKKHLKDDNAEWFEITYSPRNSGDPDFKKLWTILEKWYGAGGSSEQSEAKTNKYKELLKELKNSITNRGDAGKELFEKFSDLKIPECINVKNENGDVPDQSVTSLFGDEGDFNTTINPEGKRDLNYYLTKLLMMDYDWNFFTGATYGKHPDDNDSNNRLQGKSLKGETLNEKTNYLLCKLQDDTLGGAELEYIYWGNRDAQKNLKAVRNQIMVIRAVENFASTYTIKAINGAIQAIKVALAPIPIAALIVPPLIRAAIAMAETYMDLQALYEGKSIALYKSDLSHLTLLNDPELKNMINKIFLEDSTSSPLDHSSSLYKDEPIKFNYNQYVILVTMLFCDTDTITERTQNLVELNMNHRLGVDLAKAKADDLKFKLSNASVAVTASCKIDKMNLLILGGVFNEKSTEEYLSSDKREKMEKGFSYTVYRSY